jgi:iron complex outermembrane receptor protein
MYLARNTRDDAYLIIYPDCRVVGILAGHWPDLNPYLSLVLRRVAADTMRGRQQSRFEEETVMFRMNGADAFLLAAETPRTYQHTLKIGILDPSGEPEGWSFAHFIKKEIIMCFRRYSLWYSAGNAVVLAVLLSQVSGNVYAQSGSQRVIEEVIVSAQKRTESMQDVPVAVTAIGSQELADAGINDISDLSMQVPSLVVSTNTSPFNTSYRIRGIGNEGNIPTFEPATGLFVDGAFKSRSGLGLGELVDVESIEILKGPQSTLYGKNVTAGVISVTTKEPSQELEGSLEVTSGNENLRQVKAGINLPLSERLATRLSVVTTKRNPVQKNISGDDGRDLNQLALRGQLLFDIDDRSSLKLIASMADRDMASSMGDVYYSQSHINIMADMRANLERGDVGPNDAYDNQVNQIKNYTFIQDSGDVTVAYEYSFDAVTLNLLATYENYEADLDYINVSQIPYQIASFLDSQEGESSSFELRLSNNNVEKLSWVGGIFYFKNDYKRGDSERGEFSLLEDVEEYGTALLAELTRNNGGVVPTALAGVLPGAPILGLEGDRGFFTGKQQTDSLGTFLHANYSLSDVLEFGAGIRYSYEEKSASFENRRDIDASQNCNDDPSLNLNFICLVAPVNNNYFGADSWGDVTGTFSISWLPNDDSLIYLTTSTGFKAGGFNLEIGDFDGDSERKYDQESVSHFELGMKTEILQRTLRLNTALFHTAYENYQNAAYIGLQFIVNNAEKVVVDGFEIEATYLLGEHLTLMAAATYLDARYEEYSSGSCYYGETPDSGEFCRADGEPVPFAPEWSGSLITQWNQTLFDGELYARLAYQYTGHVNPSSERDPRHQRDPYAIIDGRVGWRNSGFDIALWGKNLTDEAFLAQAMAANIMTSVDAVVGSEEGSYQTYIGEPKSLGVTVRFYF